MGKITDPVHVFNDEDHEEKLELEQKVKDGGVCVEEAKYQFLRDGYITLEDCKKVAERLSERDGVYYSADDILEKWFKDDGVTLEDFITEEKPTTTPTSDNVTRVLEDKKILEMLEKERETQYRWLDDMIEVTEDENEIETLVSIKEVLRNAAKTSDPN